MRCHQARKRINEAFLTMDDISKDVSLLEHLRVCSACAEQAQASHLLNRDFNTASTDDTVESVPLLFLKARVEAQANLNKQKEYSLMERFTQQVRRKSRLSISLTVVVAALLVFSLVPFSINQNVGYEVAFAGVNKDLALDTDKLNEILIRLGIDADATNIIVSDCEVTCNLVITDLKSSDEAQLVRAVFEGSENIELTEDIKIIIAKVKGSALDHVKNTFFFSDDLHTISEYDAHNIVIDKLGADFNFDDFVWVSKDGDFETIVEFEGGDFMFSDSTCIQSVFISDDGNVTTDLIADVNHIMKKMFISEGSADCDTDALMNLELLNGEDLNEETIQKLKDMGFEVTVLGDDNQKVISLTKTNKLHEAVEDDKAAAKTEAELPDGYTLSQNYPNPFNPTTTISYTIPKSEHVVLEIININGQRVKTLVDGVMASGEHSVEWDATDLNGKKVASGIYLYRFNAGDVNQVKKATLLK